MIFGRYDYAVFTSFFAYAAGSVVIPVSLIALSRDLGFSLEKGGMSAGGALQLARTITMVASMLLCGFAAGKWGKRKTLGSSVAMMSVGVLLCSLAPFYGILFLALMIAGMGEGVIEGLGTPFIHALHLEEPGRYINFSHSFWSIGVMLTVLVCGGLISLGISWRILVASASCFGFIGALVLLMPQSKYHQYPEHREPIHWKQTWAHASEIVQSRRFWLFYSAMFLAGGGEFCLTFWTASFIQINFVNAAWAGGVGTACFAGGMFLGRSGWGYLIKQHHLKHLIVYSAVGACL